MRGSPLGVVFPPRGVGCWLGGDRASTSLGRIVGWAGPGCAAGHACDLSALRVRGPAPGGAPPPPGLSRCPLLPPLSLHSPPGRRRAAHAQCAHVAHARASRARSRCLHGDDPAGGMAACWCALSRGVRGSGTPPVAGRPPGATPRGAAYPPATGLPPPWGCNSAKHASVALLVAAPPSKPARPGAVATALRVPRSRDGEASHLGPDTVAIRAVRGEASPKVLRAQIENAPPRIKP